MKIISFFLTFICSYSAFARNPVGETAQYKLDRSKKRTSALIIEGSNLATASREIKDENDKKFYEINIHYKIKIAFVGNREGDQPLQFPEIYFDEEFMRALRLKKHYEGKQFNIQHLGLINSQTQDGILYKECDRIKLTGFQLPMTPSFMDLVSTLKKSASRLVKATGSKPENVVINAHISPKVPAIGAAKIDIAGSIDGMRFMVGYDYVQPPRPSDLKK